MNRETLAARFQTDLDDRRQRTGALMQEHGLRAMIVYSDAGNGGNVRYLTNYRPLFGPAVLVVRHDGELLLLITFNWDAPRARLASGIERVDTGFDMAGMLRRALQDFGIGTGDTVGLAGSGLIPYVLWRALTDNQRPEPVDMDRAFERLRLIKSPLEQDLLRQAAAATDQAIESALGEARPGMTELQLAASLEYHMKRAGADGLAFPASVASGPHTEKPVSLSSDRPFERCDLVMADVGASWEGYCADVTRTFVIGPPNQRQQEVYSAVALALQEVTEMSRPGVRASDLHQRAVQILEQHDLGHDLAHRVGHGIGLETSLEPPDLRRDDIPLEAGMTFCIEPGVYLPGFGGIKIEDDVIVQDHGPEVISRATRDLVAV